MIWWGNICEQGKQLLLSSCEYSKCCGQEDSYNVTNSIMDQLMMVYNPDWVWGGRRVNEYFLGKVKIKYLNQDLKDS